MTPPFGPRNTSVRASAARIVALIGVGVGALALFVASETMSGFDYARRTVALFGAAAIPIVALAGAHHPFPRFGAANSVTALRVALVALLGGLVTEPASERIQWLAVGATILIAALDGVDGWLARRNGQTSAFGARFDMETDAALILALSLLVWQHGKAGVWVLGCGLMRYAFVAAGVALPWIGGPLRSTVRGKSVAIGQFVGLGAALSPAVPVPFSAIIAAVALAALTGSFAVDIAWLKRQSSG